MSDRTETATLAAGCFWGIEHAFRQLDGVVDARVGYTGGDVDNPSYQQVCSDTTGHAEAVEVEFDPDRITYDALLDAFWRMHDPTQVNRQGPDVGRQYRSAIFVHDEPQDSAARASREALEASGELSRPIATEILPVSTFWPAEDYHQRYYEKQGVDPHC